MNSEDTVYCLDHGYVKLIDVYGSEKRIAQAARISYDNFDLVKSDKDDQALVRYLYENYHTSPIEMGEVLFELKLPLFVRTHFLRHRTANINEQSQRYTEVTDDMYCPSMDVRKQSKTNKQGSVEDDQFHNELQGSMQEMEEVIREIILPKYHDLVKRGVAKEIARAYLPSSMYTKMVYKMDLNNLLKFLRLRCAPDAQKETRIYANAMKDLIRPHFPTLIQCLDESMNSVTLRPDEIDHMKNGTLPSSVRRRDELENKLSKITQQGSITFTQDDINHIRSGTIPLEGRELFIKKVKIFNGEQ